MIGNRRQKSPLEPRVEREKERNKVALSPSISFFRVWHFFRCLFSVPTTRLRAAAAVSKHTTLTWENVWNHRSIPTTTIESLSYLLLPCLLRITALLISIFDDIPACVCVCFWGSSGPFFLFFLTFVSVVSWYLVHDSWTEKMSPSALGISGWSVLFLLDSAQLGNSTQQFCGSGRGQMMMWSPFSFFFFLLSTFPSRPSRTPKSGFAVSGRWTHE